MLGKHHLLISVALGGAYLYALYDMHLLGLKGIAAALLGVAVGSLLPDADAPDSWIFRKRVGGGYALRLIAWATKWLLYKPVALLGYGFGSTLDGHRRLLHSLAGTVMVGSFWLLMGTAALWTLGAGSLALTWMYFCVGMMAGYAMHIWQDGLTVGGVRWLPGISMQGRLRTGYGGWKFWAREEWAIGVALVLTSLSLYASWKIGNATGLWAAFSFFPVSFMAFCVPKSKAGVAPMRKG